MISIIFGNIQTKNLSYLFKKNYLTDAFVICVVHVFVCKCRT
jgi:uncharacterized membrane protein YwzB